MAPRVQLAAAAAALLVALLASVPDGGFAADTYFEVNKGAGSPGMTSRAGATCVTPCRCARASSAALAAGAAALAALAAGAA